MEITSRVNYLESWENGSSDWRPKNNCRCKCGVLSTRGEILPAYYKTSAYRPRGMRLHNWVRQWKHRLIHRTEENRLQGHFYKFRIDFPSLRLGASAQMSLIGVTAVVAYELPTGKLQITHTGSHQHSHQPCLESRIYSIRRVSNDSICFHQNISLVFYFN